MSYYAADQATLGDRIVAARESHRWTQKELAERLGVRRKTLADWEDDRSEPRANRLHMLSGVLGVSLVWLMTGDGDGPSDPVERAQGPRLQAEIAALRGIAQELAVRLATLEEELRHDR